MRALVTGAAGSVGGVLCSGLVDCGHTVLGLDRVSEPEVLALLYGVSASTRGRWDLKPGHALDEAESAHVGGPHATDSFRRPALDGPGA